MAEEYEPPEFEELLDLATWVHHRPYIYPQGRVNWMTQKKAAVAYKALMAEEETEEEGDDGLAAVDDDNEEMMEEVEEEPEEEPEEGPDILTPIEEDAALRPVAGIGLTREGSEGDFEAPAWRIKPSTVLLPVNCAVAVVASNRWPGAYAMARKQ